MAAWTRVTDRNEAFRKLLSPQMKAFYDEQIPSKRFMRGHVGGGPLGPGPVLSSLVAIPGQIDANFNVTTNTGNGTLYWVVTLTSGTPTAAQIEAGKNSAGNPATASGNQSVFFSGVQAVHATGLVVATTYFAFFVQLSGNGKVSNIVGTGAFTTAGPSLRFEFKINSMYEGGPT